MSGARIRRILIVGGGTAGWMVAAMFAKVLGASGSNDPGDAAPAITLVESDEIGTVGVGEATIPPIVLFNRLLGIDEDRFVRETQGTYKLGIEFVDWLHPGHRYLHSFGLFGADMNGVPFTHYWLRANRNSGGGPRDLYNAEALAARAGRFARTPPDAPASMPRINYAYQFDAGLYAAFLRRFSEDRGVSRIEGRVADVERVGDEEVAAVRLDDGRRIEADLFIDCSGFRGLLIEGALGTGYEDWSRWLPANRAVAAPSASAGPPHPYTQATALGAGWRWRIPLQHRVGNGIVFCDAFMDEGAAADALAETLGSDMLGDPRVLRFVTGRRRRTWVGNCVAIGLAAGFLEPLESTSIHLVQAAIAKLLTLFPQRRSEPALAARFNREMAGLSEGVRDFLLAHYMLTDREDTEFWRHCRAIVPPDSLAEKLAAFRRRGEAMVGPQELFREVNWFSVLQGQGVTPDDHHPVADALHPAELERRLGQIRDAVARRVATLPPHAEFLRRSGGLAGGLAGGAL